MGASRRRDSQSRGKSLHLRRPFRHRLRAVSPLAGPMSRSALFLDRDGTLIVDVGYPRDPERVELVAGAVDALRELQRDHALVIVSNQSGIGRGLIREDEAVAVHARVIDLFRAAGVTFAGAYYCPHAPEDRCRCRKPAPGLLEDAARELDLDLGRSFMIGDK